MRIFEWRRPHKPSLPPRRPPLTPEEVERLNASADKSVAECKQIAQNINDLQYLREGVQEAVRINKELSRRLAK